MGPTSIYDEIVTAKLKEWFETSDELFIELHYPHSGGSGNYYLVSSLDNLSRMVEEARSGAVFFILRQLQFPIRGIADDTLIKRALDEIQDGEQFMITMREFYPQRLSRYGSWDSHEVLVEEIKDCQGQAICVGKEPNVPDQYWDPNHDEDVIIARKP